MFLGQLFYYEKELHKISESGVATSILDIDVAGIENTFKTELKTVVEKSEMLLEFKEAFINGYEKVLIENSLFKALDFWKRITSPIFKLGVATGASDFQIAVENWLESGSFIYDLKKGLLTEGSLASTEEDYSLYYGLHVLFVINQFLVGRQDQTKEPEAIVGSKEIVLDDKSFSENPQVIIVASVEVEPLIKDINGVFVRNSGTLEMVKESIVKAVKSNTEIRLIIIDSKDNLLFREISKLNLPNILVSEAGFNQKIGDTFFDDIVRSTLGVKLT